MSRSKVSKENGGHAACFRCQSVYNASQDCSIPVRKGDKKSINSHQRFFPELTSLLTIQASNFIMLKQTWKGFKTYLAISWPFYWYSLHWCDKNMFEKTKKQLDCIKVWVTWCNNADLVWIGKKELSKRTLLHRLCCLNETWIFMTSSDPHASVWYAFLGICSKMIFSLLLY